ncbi:MAG: hypothetical protein WCS03_18125, partial [Bacteroidota bacterium]
MKPSIFNDVIGPVMRGPSSSHTAASHRIGSLIRQICSPENGKVVVEFDRKGSLATTYEGQGSAMGLICGLLGVNILDPDVVRYKELAKEKGLDIRFLITDYDASHPNTYKISVESELQEKFQFIAISTGGGMVEINRINGFKISIKGDYFETLIYCDSVPVDKLQGLLQLLKTQINHSEIYLCQQGVNNFLINIKSRESLLFNIKEWIKVVDFKWIRKTDPVLPILSGISDDLPFSSIDEMLYLADRNGYDLAEL